MILLDRVTKTYNKNLGPALDRISLHVEPKEFVVVIGQSGSGKTTLLRLLTREERASSGKIIVGGIDYDKLHDREIPLLRRKIGTVFQDFKLLPNRTVFENVAFDQKIGKVDIAQAHLAVTRIENIVQESVRCIDCNGEQRAVGYPRIRIRHRECVADIVDRVVLERVAQDKMTSPVPLNTSMRAAAIV